MLNVVNCESKTANADPLVDARIIEGFTSNCFAKEVNILCSFLV